MRGFLNKQEASTLGADEASWVPSVLGRRQLSRSGITAAPRPNRWNLCPLWVIRRHNGTFGSCPLYP